MKERPILFNAEMVNAILSGRKTQTRRVIKNQPAGDFIDCPVQIRTSLDLFQWFSSDYGESSWFSCPLGEIGDRLWVRETFSVVPRTAYAASEGVQQVISPSDIHDAAIFRAGWEHSTGGIRWRPSLHMPRWASRITLEITGVRVERLHDITLGDICKEIGCGLYDFRPATHGFHVWEDLWQSIYGADGWQANPWVWVIEFKMVGQPHDQ